MFANSPSLSKWLLKIERLSFDLYNTMTFFACPWCFSHVCIQFKNSFYRVVAVSLLNSNFGVFSLVSTQIRVFFFVSRQLFFSQFQLKFWCWLLPFLSNLPSSCFRRFHRKCKYWHHLDLTFRWTKQKKEEQNSYIPRRRWQENHLCFWLRKYL